MRKRCELTDVEFMRFPYIAKHMLYFYRNKRPKVRIAISEKAWRRRRYQSPDSKNWIIEVIGNGK